MATNVMQGGAMLYRCRRCGDVSEVYHAPSLLASLFEAIQGEPGRSAPATDAMACQAALLTVHHCRVGSLGVADLIGGVLDDEPTPHRSEAK